MHENLNENGADDLTHHIDQNSIGKEVVIAPGYSYEEIFIECEGGDDDEVHDVHDNKSQGIRQGKRQDKRRGPAPAVKSVPLGMGESIKFNMHVEV